LSDLSPEVASAQRDQAFEEIERIAEMTSSYSRSLGEAAYRGDATTVLVHLQQLRLCCVSMIQTYKDYLDGEAPARNRSDQRSGDAVA
jgi:hypothetical protein